MDYHIHNGVDAPNIDFKDTVNAPKFVGVVASNAVRRAESLGEKSYSTQGWSTLKAFKIFRSGTINVEFTWKASNYVGSIRIYTMSVAVVTKVNQNDGSPYLNDTWYTENLEIDVGEGQTVSIQGSCFNATGESVTMKDLYLKYDTKIYDTEQANIKTN